MYHSSLVCKGVIDKLYIFLNVIFSIRDEDLIELCISKDFNLMTICTVDDAILCMANIYFRPHVDAVQHLQIKGFGMDKLIEIRRGNKLVDELKIVEYADSELQTISSELRTDISFIVPPLVIFSKSKK
eukprot:NODE_488_length_7780_cov_0.211691.p6 type:complete len:129 gc:universal NODE_488_length_7780_cov_0.211691:1293-1679(+)